MNRFVKSAAFPILIVVVLAFFAEKLIAPSPSTGPVHSYQTLVARDIPNGQVKSADLKTRDNTVSVTLRDGTKYQVGYVDGDAAAQLITALEKAPGHPQFNIQGTRTNSWLSLLTYVFPFLIFIGFWIFLMNQVQGGGSRVMSFGKSKAKRMTADSPKITFRDVAGVDEAVEELHEIKEFLENPKKFQALG
ncbi:MAG: cell division protease FtsH, partial [Solirubrobacteraceae bacterium]|nr:cell division protease FtsH [Solirubrobacteraceae bacterium]